jgi:transcriptional regulator
MYAPRHFAESDPTILRDAVRQIRAGELITVGSAGIEASFVPLLMSDDAATVTGHLARGNGQWERADPSVPVLVSWVGPSAYVSPSFYPSKREHGKVVPTWNFIAVQARGTLTLHHDDGWKRALVVALTDAHERTRDEPWSVEDAPAEYVSAMVAGIVGFEVRVTSLEGKWKLSQNKSEADVAGVIAALRSDAATSTDALVADQMAQSTSQLPTRLPGPTGPATSGGRGVG